MHLRHLRLLCLAVATALSAPAAEAAQPAQLTQRAETSPARADACIRFWAEARYAAYGYNHLVHVQNVCRAAATCVVTTDVNPEPQAVEVAPGGESVVNTFLGSPARAFTPQVKCTMH